jgi:ATP-dependent Clp protease ATP-binding subunit ClpC
VRQQVEEIIGQGQQAPSGHIPFTPRAKKVLELSLREARRLGHNYIGTEHILLGLIHEGDGVGAQVLRGFGVDFNRARQQIIQLLHGWQEEEVPLSESLAAASPGELDDLRDRLAAFTARLTAIERRLRESPTAPRADS